MRLKSLGARNLELNAFTHLLPDLQFRPLAKKSPEEMNGVWMAVKDNIMVKGMPMEAGSHLLNGHLPTENATCVQALVDAGAMVIGKTAMDEFGMGSHSMHSRSGPVLNPHWPERSVSPGGSSGGSAAAVAAGFCRLALGTDTGGSVRLPAAYCNIFGFKPTYGRISRHGVVTYASSLDTVGVLAESIEWIKWAFDCMKDKLTGDMSAAPRTSKPVHKPIDKIAIGLVDELFPANCSANVMDAMERLMAHLTHKSIKIKRLRVPVLQSALPVYYITALVEASSCLARYGTARFAPSPPAILPAGLSFSEKQELTRYLGFGEQVLERIEMGTALASGPLHQNPYGKAKEARTEIRKALESAFHEVDVLLCPTAPTGPPSLADVLESEADEWDADALTVPASLAGLPAISIPLPGSLGHGFQLIGAHGRDEELLHLVQNIQTLDL